MRSADAPPPGSVQYQTSRLPDSVLLSSVVFCYIGRSDIDILVITYLDIVLAASCKIRLVDLVIILPRL